MMSNEHKKQPAGAAGNAGSGNAIGSAASGSASGSQALSESSLDAVTGGTGNETSHNLSVNLEGKGKAVFIATDKHVLGAVIGDTESDSGSGND